MMHKILYTVKKLWNRLKTRTKRNVDIIVGKEYKVWVINTKLEVQLFTWDNWQHIYPIVNQLLDMVESKAYIRTFQNFETENRWLSFGRMNWNEENNQKWTSKYQTKKYSNRNLLFKNTEIWSPDWNFCQKTNQTPDIFIKVYCTNFLDLREGIIIAIPKRIVKENDMLISSSIQLIQKLIVSSTLSSVDRYWTPSKNFPNHLNDINPHEVMNILSLGAKPA
jgi:hypothetical protein